MDGYQDVMTQAFRSELKKIAKAKQSNALSSVGKFVAQNKKPLAYGGGAVVGWEALRKANRDRKLGRQMRLRSGGY